MGDEKPVETIEARNRTLHYGLGSILVAVAFGLFYAYDLWEAVSNLIQLPAVYELYGLGGSFVPWWLLWLGVIIPFATFVLALLIGRKHNAFARAAIFLVGLAVVAGLSLGLIALEQVLRPDLLAVISG